MITITQRKGEFSLITHWIGEAYAKLTSPEYNHLRLRVWQKTGCLRTADGSDDSLIQPEGLKSYVVPPPAFLPPSSFPLQVDDNQVTPEGHMEEDAAEDVSTSDQPEDKSEIPEDRYENRNYKDDLVGRKVTALYENGWFTGSVMCFIMLNELRVNYAAAHETFSLRTTLSK